MRVMHGWNHVNDLRINVRGRGIVWIQRPLTHEKMNDVYSRGAHLVSALPSGVMIHADAYFVTVNEVSVRRF